MRGIGDATATAIGATTALVLAGLLFGAPTAESCAGPGYRQFDFWLGDWAVENRQRNPATPDDPTLHPTGTAAADDVEGPWSPFWVMRFTPRDPRSAGDPHVGPSRTPGHCPDQAARAFDFLLGDWTGEETAVGASDIDEGVARPVEVRTLSILEGCALVDHVTIGEGAEALKEFRVRSFLPSEDRWVQYSLAAGDRAFVRHEGDEGGFVAEVEAHGSPGADGPPVLERVRWRSSGDEDDRLTRETAVSEDGGATWRTVRRAELRRR